MIKYADIYPAERGLHEGLRIEECAVGMVSFSEKNGGQMFDLAQLACRIPRNSLHAIVVTNNSLKADNDFEEIFPSRTEALARYDELGLSPQQAIIAGIRLIKDIKTGKILYDVERDCKSELGAAA